MAQEDKVKTSAAKRRDLQIGTRLKHARLPEGILIRELAERVGCAESKISKIENGEVTPSLEMLRRLVETLNRDLSSFFGADINAPAAPRSALPERTMAGYESAAGR